jgi:hypothetical protein
MYRLRFWTCIAIALTSLASKVANAQGAGPETFLCVADKATGFSFNKVTKEWASTNFRASAKHLITRSKQTDVSWEVKEVGDKSAYTICAKDFNSNGNLICQGFGNEFRFNRNSLRYMNVYLIGYWTDGNPRSSVGGEEGGNTPSIEIGKCSPL